MPRNMGSRIYRIFFVLLSYTLSFAAALPAASIPANAQFGSSPVPPQEQTSSNSESSPSWDNSFSQILSDLTAFPFRHWAFILVTAGPCLLLIGLIISLHRQRRACLEHEAEAEMQYAMSAHIEEQRIAEMEEEMRQMEKLGINTNQLRMIEPGVYIAEEDSDDD